MLRLPASNDVRAVVLATLAPAGFGPGRQMAGPIDRSNFDHGVTQGLVRPGYIVILGDLCISLGAKGALAAAQIATVVMDATAACGQVTVSEAAAVYGEAGDRL